MGGTPTWGPEWEKDTAPGKVGRGQKNGHIPQQKRPDYDGVGKEGLGAEKVTTKQGRIKKEGRTRILVGAEGWKFFWGKKVAHAT